MDFTVIASPRAPHQVVHQLALAEGLRSHGLQVAEVPNESIVRTHRVACWGWRIGKRLRDKGHSVLVMERGYIGDRFAWTSLGWNGLNGRAWVPTVPEDGGDRFNAHHADLLQPWQPAGHYALIMGQVPGDASLQGLDLAPWYAQQAESIGRESGCPVMFRPHPLAGDRGGPVKVPGAVTVTGDLRPALAGAVMVVTYNSNSGVDALLAGKPTTVANEGGMAYGVTQEMRETWAHRLAWRQWSMDEIQSGFALDHVGLTDG